MRLTLPPAGSGANGTYERANGLGSWDLQSVAVLTTPPTANELMATGNLYHPNSDSLWGSFVLQVRHRTDGCIDGNKRPTSVLLWTAHCNSVSIELRHAVARPCRHEIVRVALHGAVVMHE